MYKLMSTVSDNIIFPNGRTVTIEELKKDPSYSYLFENDQVGIFSGEVFKGSITLSDFAFGYGIDYRSDDEQDPRIVLDKVIEKKTIIEEHPPLTISDTVAKAISFAALSFTDEQALEVPDLYPVYEVDHAYKKDERFTYNGRLFKVNQDHTSAAQWVPGETGTESLYTNLEMAGDGYLVWTQPTGAHNAYNTGDIVHYPTEDDPLYKSLIDGNTWSPDAYPQGWEIYNKE